MLRGRSGDSGMSQMMETQVVAEGRMPAGNGKLVARVTPVTIDAGSVGTDYNSAYRFGAGPLVARSGASAGNQSAFGAAVGVAYESERINADVGSTPLGFQYADVNAGVKVNLPVTQRTTLSLAASRRPVTDSVLSYSGAQDTRAGLRWGGVMNSSGRADTGWDDGTLGIYGYGGYGLLTGHDVARNTRWEGGGGFYIRLLDTPSNAGWAASTSPRWAMPTTCATSPSAGRLLQPQRYFAVTLPMSLSGRSGKIAYHIRGALGVQSFSENDSNFFPTNAAAQSAASSTVASANAAGLTNATSAVYPGQSRPAGVQLVGSMEYRPASRCTSAACSASTMRATTGSGTPASTCATRCSARPARCSSRRRRRNLRSARCPSKARQQGPPGRGTARTAPAPARFAEPLPCRITSPCGPAPARQRPQGAPYAPACPLDNAFCNTTVIFLP